MERKLLTRKDLALKFSVHTETIRRWEKQGILPVAITIKGKHRYDEKVIESIANKGIK
jgi:predicted site-specific integrase-resolvase